MRNGLPRILVIEMGDLVDVCSAVPAIHLLRESYPDAQLDVLVSPETEDLLHNHPCVDDVIVWGEGGEPGIMATNRVANVVKSRRYEMLLDFPGTKTSGLITWRSNAQERFGFSSPRSTVGVRHGYSHTFRLGDEARNRTYQNLLLCGEVCGHTRPKGVSLPVSDDQAEMTSELFHAQFEGDKRIIGVGIGNEVEAGNVPFIHALCERIASDGRFDLMLIPLPEAREQAVEIANRFSRGTLLPPRVRNVSDCVALIQECHMAVTTSGAVSHICYLSGIKAVRLLLGAEDDARAPIEPMDRVECADGAESSIDQIERLLVVEFYPILD